MARLYFIGFSESKMLIGSFLLFLTLSLFLLQCNAISEEGKILLQIKEEWNDTHNVLSNWNASDENPCGWNGVFCDYIGFNVVTKVNLSNTSIGGNLTSTICTLPNLTELILELNHFRGPFPDGLLACKRLQTLDLSANLFVGSLPRAINQLVELRHLILGSNNFTGDIPPEIGQLTNLVNFSASNNRLWGVLPDELAGLRSINSLQLDHNLLSGEIPKGIMSLANLSEINLANNKLTGEIPPWLGSMSTLNALDLSNNLLEGGIPPELGNLRLVIFNVSGNQLSGSIPYTLEVWAFNDSFLGNPSLCSDPGFKLRVGSCSSRKSSLHHYLVIILVPIVVSILFSCLVYVCCFSKNTRVSNFFLGKPSSSTSWEERYQNSVLQRDESYFHRQMTL